MKIPQFIAGAAVAAIIGLQAWMLVSISTLKEQMAALSVEVKHLAVDKYAIK